MRPRAGRPSAAVVFCASAALCATWTLFAGKDLNWDLLHYHFYDAHALLEGRLGQDYFAASTQSYLNPLGYVPFYLMVSAGWHSVLVSMLFAAVHAACLALLFGLGWVLFAHRGPRERLFASVLAAALGVASAVFWATVGTSFLDPLLAVPMLGGTLLLIGARPENALGRAGWAGVLFGVAAALKYSNAYFALAGLVLAGTMPARGAARVRALAAYMGAGALSTAVLAGPWMMAMDRQFGNPFFPHFNAVFRSPEFPPINLTAARYSPQTWWDALAFPFQLASHSSMTYVEIPAPDVRFAALIVFAAVLAVATALRRRHDLAAPAAALGLPEKRLLAFFALAFAAWVWTSANGRYGMFVLLLAGPCLARLVDRLMPFRPACACMLAIVGFQIGACVNVATTRWFVSERWSRHWFPFVVPERARSTPALYLTVEAQAMGVVVPYLHPASSFVNLRGQYSLPSNDSRLRALFTRYGENVRVLGRALRAASDGAPRRDVIDVYDTTLLRFGFRVDSADCFTIGWQPDSDDWLSRMANRVSRETGSRAKVLSLGSCAVRRATRDPQEVEEERRISSIFDRIERSCPRLFRGQTAVTERLAREWSRDYVGLEARLETQSGYAVLVPYFKLKYVNLGSLAAWSRGDGPPPVCRDTD